MNECHFCKVELVKGWAIPYCPKCGRGFLNEM